MASIRTAPCDWPLAERACPALEELEYGLDEDVREAATAYLWEWTHRAYGLCELTVRPCRQDCPEGDTTYLGAAGVPTPRGPNAAFHPVLVNGDWLNLSCGRCRGGCGCDALSQVRLPGPIDSVTKVLVDGVELQAAAYRVDNRTRVARTDGERWPVCQDLGKPTSEPGTWAITYLRGTPVPKGGEIAAAVLACEMAKALEGRECELPERVANVVREGVSMTILDAFEGLEAGRTGLWLVDSWVASVTKTRRRARVLSPDTLPARVRTDGP